MIARPLDLASRRRPPPRSLDAFFYVNVGAILLFFTLFGSRFVLSPGLSTDFSLPKAEGVTANTSPTDVVIAVQRTDMALVDGAVLNFDELQDWLIRRARTQSGLRLLVQTDADVSTQDIMRLHEMAARAGFAGIVIAAEAARGDGGAGGRESAQEGGSK